MTTTDNTNIMGAIASVGADGMLGNLIDYAAAQKVFHRSQGDVEIVEYWDNVFQVLTQARRDIKST